MLLLDNSGLILSLFFKWRKKKAISLFSTDTGICIEDVIQTLIDLRIAHTGNSTNEINLKQSEIRNRRRQDNNNNNIDLSAILVIDTDVLRTASNRLTIGNLSSKNNQNLFDPTYLRLNNRRWKRKKNFCVFLCILKIFVHIDWNSIFVVSYSRKGLSM